MLKRNRNWRNKIGFFVTFLSLVKFQFGGGPPAPTLGYAFAPNEENKKVFTNFPRGFWRFPTKLLLFKQIVLSSSRGQGNFRGLEASRARPRTWPSRPRTSKCVLEGVLEDFTSGKHRHCNLQHWCFDRFKMFFVLFVIGNLPNRNFFSSIVTKIRICYFIPVSAWFYIFFSF